MEYSRHDVMSPDSLPAVLSVGEARPKGFAGMNFHPVRGRLTNQHIADIINLGFQSQLVAEAREKRADSLLVKGWARNLGQLVEVLPDGSWYLVFFPVHDRTVPRSASATAR